MERAGASAAPSAPGGDQFVPPAQKVSLEGLEDASRGNARRKDICDACTQQIRHQLDWIPEGRQFLNELGKATLARH